MSDPSNSSRLDRVEAVLEKLADRHSGLDEHMRAFREETESFERAVRGAIMAQQEQIADAMRLSAENTRNIAILSEHVQKHDKVLADLERQWQAYLSTIHPKQ